MTDRLPGGKGDNRPDSYFNPKWLAVGIRVELEHTNDPAIAKEIAKDHLTEDPLYYKKLRKIEKSMDKEIAILKSEARPRLLASNLPARTSHAITRGERGGRYYLDRHGNKRYVGREYAQSVQNIKTATKAAMRAMREGKIGEYEKARKFLSQYDNHENPNVRRIMSLAHDILHRSADAMVGKSKTVKAAHIYSLIRDHHKQKASSQSEKQPVAPSGVLPVAPRGSTPTRGSLAEFYRKKAEYHQAKMQEHNEGWRKAKEKEREAARMNRSHWKYHAERNEHERQYMRHKRKYLSAQQKAALGRSIFGVSMTKAKQLLHLEKRRNKRGVIVGKWVGEKKPTKKAKSAKKPKAIKPKVKPVAKRPVKKTGKKVAKKQNTMQTIPKATQAKPTSTKKKKPAFYHDDLNALQRELDFVRDPVKAKKYRDLIDWAKVEHAVKRGTDAQIASALKHVRGVLRSR